MKNTLILAGDRSREKAFQSYLKITAASIILGMVLLFLCFSFDGYNLPYSMWRYMGLIQFAPIIVGAAGLIMILAGLAAPFLAIYQAQKCYIDVYEDRVVGAYLQRQKGMVDQYISFEFTYDKIIGVSSHKNQVLLQTAAGTYTCIALNADEICREIRTRIH